MESVAVVDIGSSAVKAGWAGDDVPSVIFPSVSAKYQKNLESIECTDREFSSVNLEYAAADVIHPVHRGIVKDWDKLEALWNITCNEIGISPSDSVSFMIAEAPKCTPADRVKWADMLFEKFRVPSISMGNSSSLSMFAAGRTTGLVVECGAGLTTSIPVFEGLALNHAAICTNYGGQDLSANLKQLLQDNGVVVDNAVAKMLKEQMAMVDCGQSPPTDEMNSFVLPDGNEVTVPSRIFTDCCDPLFHVDDSKGQPGIANQVFESISLCDDTIRRDLIQNIIIAGGTTMLSGFGDRLGTEVNGLLRPLFESRGVSTQSARILPSSLTREPGFTHQRKVAAWIGGSIVGSMDTYRDLKLTRQEWEESGEAAVHAKCF